MNLAGVLDVQKDLKNQNYLVAEAIVTASDVAMDLRSVRELVVLMLVGTSVFQ